MAKFILLTASCRVCDFLFASTILRRAATATTATTMNMAIETIISTRVNPEKIEN
jgi:hypothetical protein